MAFVGKTNATSLNATTLSITRTGVAAGSLLVLKVSWENLTTATIATPTGWTSAENPAGQSNGVTQTGSAIFYKENAPSGSNAASIALDATSAGDATIEEHDDHPTTSTLDVHTNNGGTTGTSGNTGTTATAKLNAMVAAAIGVNSGAGPAADGLSSPASSGYTSSGSWTNEATNSGGEHSYKLYASAAGQIASWTWTGNSSFVATIATFKLKDKNYSAAGVATVTGTGASTVAVPFSAAGAAAVTGAGASVVSAAGSITATGTAAGTGAATASGVITETASATAVGVGASTDSGAFSSAGSATVIGVSNQGGVVSADGSIAASATATGVAATIVSAAGSITASATATAASASSARRHVDGPGSPLRVRRRRCRDDDDLMLLAALVVPLISHGGATWQR